MTAFQGTDRFEVLRHLGTGSFGEVYEVFDRTKAVRVALKHPHITSADSLYYFKREFRALADEIHPNLVALYELVGDSDHWFFTMELVEGTRFQRFLRNAGIPASSHSATKTKPDFTVLRELLHQLAEGLMAIHAAGKLHRDIKPSNVLVTREGRLVILDFGLTVDFAEDQEDTLATRMIGTPAYMAPEQLEGYRGTEASDWYSVGIMLYEALTGKKPFNGSVGEIARQKNEDTPVSPSHLSPGIPPDLEEICMRLIHRDPLQRLTGAELCSLLERTRVPQQKQPEPSGTNAYLVGRDNEIQALRDAFAESRSGQPPLVHLHGASGTGKTYLLKAFSDELRKQNPDVVILQGRCYEQESVPYKSLDTVIDSLSNHLSHLPGEMLAAVTPRNAPALARLFPVMSRMEAFQAAPRQESSSKAGSPESPTVVLRQASVALRDLLARLGDQHPVVLIIDDLQWGDSDSSGLIREILSPPDPPALLLVVAYRSEEASSSPALIELLSAPTGATSRDVALRSLGQTEAESLALRLIGPQVTGAPMIASRIARYSGGNPFFIGELAQHIRIDDTDPAGSADVNLFSFIVQRMTALSPEVRRVVEILALAGHPLPWEVVKTAANVEGSQLPPAVIRKAGRFLRTRTTASESQTIEIYHDFVSKAVTSAMTTFQKREGFKRLAQSLEEHGWAEPETLAKHWINADDIQKAYELTTKAADQASFSLAFKNAANLYRKAMAMKPARDESARDLRLCLAQTLSSANMGKEAAEIYLQLASESKTEALSYRRKAAEELFRCGCHDQALSTIKPLLAAKGLELPSTRWGTWVTKKYYSLYCKYRKYDFVAKDEKDIPKADLEKLDLLWATVQGLGSGTLMRGLDIQDRHLLMALNVGEASRVVRAMAFQILPTAIYDRDRELRSTHDMITRSISLAEKLGDPALTAYAYMMSGIAMFFRGRWNNAVEFLNHSRNVYTNQCVGVSAELSRVHHHLISTKYILGEVDDVFRTLPEFILDARERGDFLAEANLLTGYGIYATIAKGEPETALRHIRRASEICSSEEFHYQRWQIVYCGGAIYQYLREPHIPYSQLSTTQAELESYRLFDIEYVRLAWLEHLGRISLAYARTCPDGSEEKRKALDSAHGAIKRIKVNRDRSRFLKRQTSDNWDLTYCKLLAVEAAALGNTELAIRLLHDADIRYTSNHMPIHANSAKLCRGILMGPSGKGIADEAAAWMRDHGIVDPERYANFHTPCTL